MKVVRNQKLQVVSLSDMAVVIEQVAQKNMTGIFNIATPQTVSRKELAGRLGNLLEIKNLKIKELPLSYFDFADKRANNPSMKIDRFISDSGFRFQTIDKILHDFLKEAKSH